MIRRASICAHDSRSRLHSSSAQISCRRYRHQTSEHRQDLQNSDYIGRFISSTSLQAKSLTKHFCIGKILGINKQLDLLKTLADLLGTLTGLRTFNTFVVTGWRDKFGDRWSWYTNTKKLGKDLMPSRALFHSLDKMSVNVGVIFCIDPISPVAVCILMTVAMFLFTNDKQAMLLSGETMVRHRVLLAGQNMPNDLRIELVYSTKGEDKNFTNLFSKTRKHVLNSTGRIALKSG